MTERMYSVKEISERLSKPVGSVRAVVRGERGDLIVRSHRWGSPASRRAVVRLRGREANRILSSFGHTGGYFKLLAAPPSVPDGYSIPEVAAILSVTRAWLYKVIASGELRTVDGASAVSGGRMVVTVKDLESFVQEAEVVARV